MVTNNALNLKSSGIVSYDGAGVFSALANPLTVANGGLGVASTTAYTVQCGGTTSTNPVQNIASVGVSGQFLTSNGASALPTFQGSGGFTWSTRATAGSMADSTTYYVRYAQNLNVSTTSGTGSQRCTVPFACTLDSAYGWGTTTTGSTTATTVAVRLNNSSNTNLTTTLSLGVTPYSFNATGIGLSVAAGDYLEVIFITPVWPTNPLNTDFQITLYFK